MSVRSLRILAVLLMAGVSVTRIHAQPGPPVTVDDQGVMHWSESGDEVTLFGVNYTTPHAYAYRAHGYVGADRRQSIDADVNHLARLGLDAFRIHVWDREISDRDGNLVENDHLDLLDYLLARLEEQGIKSILTPIAWWGTGYPERDQETTGFSNYFGKGDMSVDPVAREAQKTYLKQFITHVNPYTGKSYRDDPDIIAVELFNEPSHPGGPEETTRFIDALTGALRQAGFEKPVFYNISQGYSESHGEAVCAAEIQGVSCQWYPTGLVRGSTIRGNMLPNVDRYPTPFSETPACSDKARMVYEFDAADVAASYMYPAMARAFRGAGFQFAAQFAYDPVAIAWSNSEYQTHFLNLVYAPGKAISFMIAGEVFRHVPRGESFGTYPESASFGPFRVSYEQDLSEMVADTVFYHSNSTLTPPPVPSELRHVAGVGSSPIVSYEGTGAYFLDRESDGVWRLEVYPDVVWVEDPFARPSLDRSVARVNWATWPMEVALPDLGTGFAVTPANAGNDHRPDVSGATFDVRPGVYLVTRSGVAIPESPEDRRAFVVPAGDAGQTEVMHVPPAELPAGVPFRVRAEVMSWAPVDSVRLLVSSQGGFGRFRRASPPRLERIGGYTYEATLPAEQVRSGLLNYRLVVYQGDTASTFPGGEEGTPSDWDFTGNAWYEIPVVREDVPIVLFDARRDMDRMLLPNPWGYVRFRTSYVGGTLPGTLALRAVATNLEPEPHHLAVRTWIPVDHVRGRVSPDEGATMRVLARAVDRESVVIDVGLVERDGAVWSVEVPITDTWKEVTVPLALARRVPLALLPRPYPGFLPYSLESTSGSAAPNLSNLDGLQIMIGGESVRPEEWAESRGFEIERVLLIQ